MFVISVKLKAKATPILDQILTKSFFCFYNSLFFLKKLHISVRMLLSSKEGEKTERSFGIGSIWCKYDAGTVDAWVEALTPQSRR